MSTEKKAFAQPDDGCRYYTPEEYAQFGNLLAPVEFDSSYIRRKHLDVPYGTLPEQKLDLYLPDGGEGPCPVIFYVHGGGWMMGTKTLGAITCVIGALDRGYAVIAPDYRLAPAVTFPEFIFDIKTAVRWARAHAEEYGLDPERIGMIGDSAGGHISLMMGFTAGRPEYEGEQYGWPGVSSAVQAVCDMYGPSDLSADAAAWYRASGVKRFPHTGGEREYEPMFGTDNKNLLRLISPISFVTADIPPVMIQQGRDDGIVPYQHSQILAERIAEVCGPDRVEYHLYEGRNHSDPAFLTEESVRQVVDFFDRRLKK